MNISTTNLSPGSGLRSVVAGLAPGEHPLSLRIVGVHEDGSREELPTEFHPCRRRHDDEPWSVELRAYARDPYLSFEVHDGYGAELGYGALQPVPSELPLRIHGSQGDQVVDLAKLAKGKWRRGIVSWELEGNGEVAGYGAVRWAARCLVDAPVIELDLVWNNHDARKPAEDLRIDSACIELPSGWDCFSPILYPTASVQIESDSTRVYLIGERTALLSGRHLTRRLVFAAPDGYAEASGIASRLHRGTIDLGELRSFGDPGSARAPYAPHGDRISAWGLDVPSLSAAISGELEGIEQAIGNGERLPGDVKVQGGRHGAIYTTGDDYGGTAGGAGLEVRFCPKEAIVGSPDAVRLLEHQAWAQEGRGLGLIWWGGESFELPRDPSVEPANAELPKSLRDGLTKDTLAGINYELAPGFTSWVEPDRAQGWLGGDPFGFSSLPHYTGDEPDAAHREKELRLYGWIDRQHLLRVMRHRAALAALANDWISKVELEVLADTVRVDCWEGDPPNAELGDQWRHSQAHPLRGIAPAGRQLSETARAVIEAFSFGKPTNRDRWYRWLSRFLDAVIDSAIPSGSTRDHGFSKIAKACSPGRPYDDLRGVSQSWYAALLTDSVAGAQVVTSGRTWAAQGAAAALEWWLVPEARSWLNYAAVADRKGDPPYQKLSDVPAEARSTAPGAVSPAYDSYYHPQALGQAMLSAYAFGRWGPIASACYQLSIVAGGVDVGTWLQSRPIGWLGMDMPIRSVAERIEELDPDLWEIMANAHAAMLSSEKLEVLS